MTDDMTKSAISALEAGATVPEVATDMGLDLGDCDGYPAVLLPGWTVDDGNAAVPYGPDEVGSAEEAAERYVADGDWGERDRTLWIRVSTWRQAIYLDDDGDVREGPGDEESHRVTLDPDEPTCDGDSGEHEWCDEEGRQAHGGGVRYSERCRYCGIVRATDTWAHDRQTGEQGLHEIRYGERPYLTPARAWEIYAADEEDEARELWVKGGDEWDAWLAERTAGLAAAHDADVGRLLGDYLGALK